jgi:excinuclease UvrABC helicase subunit UvrB
MENKHLYNRVLAFIKLFNSTPYHFANFILENDILSKNFIQILENMEDIILEENNDLVFSSIDDMKTHYNKILSLTKNVSEDVISDLKQELTDAIEEENFERARELRDLLKTFDK